MSELARILPVNAVRARLPAGSKKMLFQHLATLAAGSLGVDQSEILASLNKREKSGVTAYGGGTAIPHGRLAGLSEVHAFFARLAEPVDYEAVDGVPVDLVLMLLSPPDAGVAHLKALAAASRLLRDQATVNKLRGARSRDALFALLANDEARDVA